MNKVLEFKVRYSPEFNTVNVTLVRKNEDQKFGGERIGSIDLWVSPSWHSIGDVERKVAKAKDKLLRKYQNTKHFTLAVSMIAELASEGQMIIQDQKTIDLVNKFANRVFEKTAKVFTLPRR